MVTQVEENAPPNPPRPDPKTDHHHPPGRRSPQNGLSQRAAAHQQPPQQRRYSGGYNDAGPSHRPYYPPHSARQYHPHHPPPPPPPPPVQQQHHWRQQQQHPDGSAPQQHQPQPRPPSRFSPKQHQPTYAAAEPHHHQRNLPPQPQKQQPQESSHHIKGGGKSVPPRTMMPHPHGKAPMQVPHHTIPQQHQPKRPPANAPNGTPPRGKSSVPQQSMMPHPRGTVPHHHQPQRPPPQANAPKHQQPFVPANKEHGQPYSQQESEKQQDSGRGPKQQPPAPTDQPPPPTEHCQRHPQQKPEKQRQDTSRSCSSTGGGKSQSESMTRRPQSTGPKDRQQPPPPTTTTNAPNQQPPAPTEHVQRHAQQQSQQNRQEQQGSSHDPKDGGKSVSQTTHGTVPQHQPQQPPIANVPNHQPTDAAAEHHQRQSQQQPPKQQQQQQHSSAKGEGKSVSQSWPQPKPASQSGQPPNQPLQSGQSSRPPPKESKTPPVQQQQQQQQQPQKQSAATQRAKAIWKATFDKRSGRHYYYHRKTRMVTWEKPVELGGTWIAPDGSSSNPQGTTTSRTTTESSINLRQDSWAENGQTGITSKASSSSKPADSSGEAKRQKDGVAQQTAPTAARQSTASAQASSSKVEDVKHQKADDKSLQPKTRALVEVSKGLESPQKEDVALCMQNQKEGESIKAQASDYAETPLEGDKQVHPEPTVEAASGTDEKRADKKRKRQLLRTLPLAKPSEQPKAQESSNISASAEPHTHSKPADSLQDLINRPDFIQKYLAATDPFHFFREADEVAEPPAKKRRGRPPKCRESASNSKDAPRHNANISQRGAQEPRRRGRPPKKRDNNASQGEPQEPRRRGRPSKKRENASISKEAPQQETEPTRQDANAFEGEAQEPRRRSNRAAAETAKVALSFVHGKNANRGPTAPESLHSSLDNLLTLQVTVDGQPLGGKIMLADEETRAVANDRSKNSNAVASDNSKSSSKLKKPVGRSKTKVSTGISGLLEGRGKVGLDSVVLQTTGLLQDTIRAYPWMWPDSSADHAGLVATALQQVSRDVILPSMRSHIHGEIDSPLPIVFGTLLHLREIMIINAKAMFGPAAILNGLEEDFEYDDNVNAETAKACVGEAELFSATTVATGVIMTALEKVKGGRLCENFLRIVDAYDDGDKEFSSLLGPLDRSNGAVLPGGKSMENDERDMWQASYNNRAEQHPVTLKRRLREAGVKIPAGCVSAVAQTNAVHLTILELPRHPN